ncbi:MAG: MBL fold metallo-hydrolase [Nocardioides sp.]|nr:MBL fold metallo-hydrolase [Nocardioides sp.]
MARVDVLIAGHVEQTEAGSSVHPTVSLVRDGDLVVVVDPGILSGPSLLVDALAAHDLSVYDVTHVFVTHHHIDHTRNVGVFPMAVVVDVDSVYDGSLWLEHDGDGHHLSADISVIETPGHAQECAALVVSTDDGTVVLTHAWWFADMTPVQDPLAWDQSELERSRERILAIADIVVPGHGAPFRPRDVRGEIA